MDEMKRTITIEEQTPQMLMEILGVDEIEANMILAIERGEIEGDIVEESE
jgi:hypothetical protein